jgi:hypothetical protein
MKKLAIIFAFIIFGATTSFAQFSYTGFGGREVSNTNKPFEIIDFGDQRNSQVTVRIQEYYLEWNESYVKIQIAGYLEDGELITLEEQFLNYKDVKKQNKIEKTSAGANNKPGYTITLDSNKLPTIDYREKIYLKSHKSSLSLPFADDKAFLAFIAKIQDKALDLALDLDKETARFDFEDEVEHNNSKSENSSTTSESSASTESDDDEKSNESSNTSNSSSNSTPQAKTEVTVEIKNKSNSPLEIYYKDNPKNSSKTSTSINARSSKRISIKVGGVVYSAGGQELLRVTADMDDTEQIIAK